MSAIPFEILPTFELQWIYYSSILFRRCIVTINLNQLCWYSTPISKIQLQINIFIFFWGATVRLNFCTFLYGTIPVGKKYHSPALYISFILQIICKGQSYHQKVTISAAILIAIYSKKTFVLENLIGVSRVPGTIENQTLIFQCCNISLAWLLDQPR